MSTPSPVDLESIQSFQGKYPRQLWWLFFSEMWERFSFYGMRALLVLYAVAATHAANPGLGWAEPQAMKLYGWYLGLVYGTAVIGGWIAVVSDNPLY